MTKAHQHPLEKILASRIAIIDGAMGTTIRTYGMAESIHQTILFAPCRNKRGKRKQGQDRVAYQLGG